MRSDEDGSGSTRNANEGVGMGSVEKVAQEGDTEARGVNEALHRALIVNERISRLEARSNLVLANFSDLTPRLDNLEGRVSGLFGRIKALEVGLDPAKLREAMEREKRRVAEGIERRADAHPHPSPYQETAYPGPIRLYGSEGLREVLGERPDLARPSCDCPHEMRSDCATCNPCTPAPPLSAEPAEETSSGRERCGEGTAGGAGDCCWRMQEARHRGEVELFSGEWVINLFSEDPMASVRKDSRPDLTFCPWCATPLRVEGELKVGNAQEPVYNPGESGDVSVGGEG